MVGSGTLHNFFVVIIFLFLHVLGLSTSNRGQLIRAAGGIEFAKLEASLKVSEAKRYPLGAGDRSGNYGWMDDSMDGGVANYGDFDDGYGESDGGCLHGGAAERRMSHR